MLKRTALIVSAFAILAVLGCRGGSAAVVAPSEPAGITGTITQLDRSQAPGVFGTILVEGGTQPAGAVSDKAAVTITESTQVARAGKQVPPEQLEVGMTVAVWFEGPVAESYPVQGSAKFVEIR